MFFILSHWMSFSVKILANNNDLPWQIFTLPQIHRICVIEEKLFLCFRTHSLPQQKKAGTLP